MSPSLASENSCLTVHPPRSLVAATVPISALLFGPQKQAFLTGCILLMQGVLAFCLRDTFLLPSEKHLISYLFFCDDLRTSRIRFKRVGGSGLRPDDHISLLLWSARCVCNQEASQRYLRAQAVLCSWHKGRDNAISYRFDSE